MNQNSRTPQPLDFPSDSNSSSLCRGLSLARNEIDTFYGLIESHPTTNSKSLARNEIDTFLGLQNDEPTNNGSSLARNEIDTFLGLQDCESPNNKKSLARQELEAFHGQHSEHSDINLNSLARKEIDSYENFYHYQPQPTTTSLARQEIDLYYKHQHECDRTRQLISPKPPSHHFNEIAQIHRAISQSRLDRINEIDDTLRDVYDILQLTNFVNEYEEANQKLRNVEEVVNDFIESSQISIQSRSILPSLNNSREEEQDAIPVPSFNSQMETDLKNIKYEAEALQTKVNEINRQIQVLSGQVNQFSPSRSNYNSPSSSRRLKEPLNASSNSTSPRSLRNKIRSTQKRADDGDPEAMYSLGACYALGDGVSEDKEKALYYYQMAADRGNRNAQYAAAACYSYGKGTEVNKEKAFELYYKAADQGHPKAQFAVGHFYEYGQGGVEMDHEKAKLWYQMAADNGHSGAMKILEDFHSDGSNRDSNG